MSENNGWGVALLLGWLLWLNTPHEDDSKITGYERYCSDYESEAHACKAKTYVSRYEFRVDHARQTVRQKDGIFPLKSCEVYDVENWKCKQGDLTIG